MGHQGGRGLLTKCSSCGQVFNIEPEHPPVRCNHCQDPFLPVPMPPKRGFQKVIMFSQAPNIHSSKLSSVMKTIYVMLVAVVLFFTAQTSMTFVSELDWERTEGVVTFSYSGWGEQRYNFSVEGENYSGTAPCPTIGAGPGGGSGQVNCPAVGSIAKVMYDPANPENNHLGSKFGSLFAALAMWFFTALWVILPLLVKFNVLVFAEDLTSSEGEPPENQT